MAKTKKTTKELIPCAVYLRVSGTSQIGGDGPQRQRKACEEYAAKNGLRIAFEAFDAGVSGTTDLEDREELPHLFDYIIKNKIKVVLTESSQRLSRRLMVSEIILQKFADLQCKVYEANSGIELTADDGEGGADETRVLVRQVLAAIHQFQKSMDVKKLRSARKRIREREGKCEGRKALQSTPEGWVTVRYMQQLRRKPKQTGTKKTKGMTYEAIAKQLNDQFITTVEGKKWTGPNVSNVLNRELVDSDETYHTQEEIDMAFNRIMPISPKQMALLGADDMGVDHGIHDDDIEVTLAAYWEDNNGTGKRKPIGLDDKKQIIWGEWSDEDLSRGRKLWRSIGIKGFTAPKKPTKPSNVISMKG